MKENNKLIAEFMGMISHHQDSSVLLKTTEYGNDVVLVRALDYNSEWNSLMPVYKKCYDTPYYGRSSRMFGELFRDGDGKLFTDITLLYNAVVEFIKWFNENN